MADVMVVSTKGQVTLPVRIRSKFNIKPGDRIIGELRNGAFVIKKSRDFFSMRGNFSLGKIPDDEEELLTPESGKSIMNRE